MARLGSVACVSPMAAGLIHQVNNQISYVVLAAAHAQRLLNNESELGQPQLHTLRELATGIRDAVQGMRESISEFRLVFGLHDANADATVDLSQLLDATVKLVRTGGRRDIQFIKVVEKALLGPGRLWALVPITIHLLLNAFDALEQRVAFAPRPRIELRCGQVSYDAGTDGVDTGAVDTCLRVPKTLRLQVIDNGHGMDEATRARVFEPLFTTRDPSRRSGLGLTIAGHLVNQLQGTIEVDSRPNHGTAVTVTVPAS